MEYSRNSRSGHLLPGVVEGSVSVGSQFKRSASCVYRRGGGGVSKSRRSRLLAGFALTSWEKAQHHKDAAARPGEGWPLITLFWWVLLPFVTTVRQLSQVVRLAPRSYRHSSPLPPHQSPLPRRRAFDSMEAGPIIDSPHDEMHTWYIVFGAQVTWDILPCIYICACVDPG